MSACTKSYINVRGVHDHMLEYLDATEELLVMGVERSDIIIIITYYNISHWSFISYLLHNHSDATYEYHCLSAAAHS